MQKAKGRHCGGTPPLGYDIVEHKLAVNPEEAETVRHVFREFLRLGSTTQLVKTLAAEGIRTKAWTTAKGRQRQGRPFDKQQLYRLLQNRKYIGEITHGKKIYPGEHEAIVDRRVWDDAQSIFAGNRHERGGHTRNPAPALLKGILHCGHCRGAMMATYSSKKAPGHDARREYRYYLCRRAGKEGHDVCPVKTAPAHPLEAAVAERVRALLRDPDLLSAALRILEEDGPPRYPDAARAALIDLDALWETLFPAEQARIVRLLVERIDLHPEGLNVAFRATGLRALARELAPPVPAVSV